MLDVRFSIRVAMACLVAATLAAPASAQFVQPPRSFTGPNFSGAVVADFTGDGVSDLAVVQDLGPGNGSQLIVFTGLGPGAFDFGSPLQFAFLPYKVTRLDVGDIDGDGRADILVNGTQNGTNQFTVFRTRQLPGGLEQVGAFGSAAFGSGTGLLRTRLAFAAGGALQVFDIDSSGNFLNVGSVPVSAGATAVAGTDLNGDGVADFIVASPGLLEVVTIGVGGQVTSVVPRAYNSTAAPLIVQTGDLNGDGRQDVIVLTDDHTLWTFLNSANGLTAGVSTTIPSAITMRAADLNGDGFADVVIGTSNPGNAFQVLFANTDGTLRAPINYNFPGSGVGLSLVDLDKDGRQEIAIGDGTLFYVFDRTPVLLIDAGADINVTTDNTNLPIDLSVHVVTSQTNVAFAWFEGGEPIGTGANVSHQFSLGTHTVVVVGTAPDGSAASDTVVVTVTLPTTALQQSVDALQGKINALTGATGPLDTNVGSRASQTSVDGIGGSITLIGQQLNFFQTLLDTNVGSRASQSSLDSFHFDVNQGLASRASQASLDQFHIDFTNVANGLGGILPAVQNVGTKVDALYGVTNTRLDAMVSSRASHDDIGQVLTAIQALPHTSGGGGGTGGGITQANLDALGASIVGAITASRDAVLRGQIEQALAHEDRIALFFLPIAKGGHLEDVRAIVTSVAQAIGASPDRPAVDRLLAKGNALLAAGDYRGAYDAFADAYRLLTHAADR